LHRGGEGPPLVLVHGALDTWRTWELVLPALERRHEVLAPTLPGHAGGPPLVEASVAAAADAVEAAMDDAGFEHARIAGNSLGGFVALLLAARGRATSMVALAPAGGWADATLPARTLSLQRDAVRGARLAAPSVDAVLATGEGRRRLTRLAAEQYEHIPTELIAHQVLGTVLSSYDRLLGGGRDEQWELDPELVTCPLRFVWGTADRLLPWPDAAVRYRAWFPQADWVVLDDVGHLPQLDVPLAAADLIG
jgi:pimeloyl-ACP methyl ester carboxylesterase